MGKNTRFQLVVSGFGGQGAVFVVKLLSICAGLKKLKYLGTENHGMSQRGGSVSCFIKIGDFYSPVIDENQADMILALEQNEGLRTLQYLKEGGTLVVNCDEALPQLTCKSIRVDAFALAQKGLFSVQALNVFMVGLASTCEGFPFDEETLKEGLRMINKKVADANIEVFMLGKNYGGTR